MRHALAALFLLASIIGLGAARAAECPPDALGVSRTIVVDPSEHPRIGGLQYGETLPLNDKEVVLTFDDGPLPPNTEHILETLASECVKATFFMVGQMANTYPALVRRVHAEGHTIGTHSQNHPFSFQRMSVDQAATEIQGGFNSVRAALGDPNAVAPFFRIPGLLRQNSVEQYLAAHDIMTWSLDVVADDWTHIGAEEIARRAISRLEANHKGILLLHDIHKKTALALPIILAELKARGFKIVHVVPATDDLPKTATLPAQWFAHVTREQKLWSHVVDLGSIRAAPPALPIPSPRSFGLAYPPGRRVVVSLVSSVDWMSPHPGDVPLPPVLLWRRPNSSDLATRASLPIPDAQIFIYDPVLAATVDGVAGHGPKRVASAKTVPARRDDHHATKFTGPAAPRTATQAQFKSAPFGHEL